MLIIQHPFACFAKCPPLILLSACLLMAACSKQDNNPTAKAVPGEPAATVIAEMAGKPVTSINPLRDAWFGETHMHTAYSLDAG